MDKLYLKSMMFLGLCYLCILLKSSMILAAEVPISEENFPGKYFREYVLKKIDQDKNARLSQEEIKKTQSIVIRISKKYDFGKFGDKQDYKGIEFFHELEELEVTSIYEPKTENESSNVVDISLDVSRNVKLKKFICKGGEVEQLDLSVLPALEEVCLQVSDCPVQNLLNQKRLKILEISVQSKQKVLLPKEIKELKKLNLRNFQDIDIAFSESPNLTEVSLESVRMSELDLSGCKRLKSFVCSWSDIPNINLSNCSGLRTVIHQVNSTRKICFSGCFNVKKLVVGGPLQELDVRDLVKLESLSCGGPDFNVKTLNLRKNHKLKVVDCSYSKLCDIKLSARAKYKSLCLDRTHMKKLNLRNVKVQVVNCNNSTLKKLYVRGNRFIRELYCKNNQLSKLDLRGCKRLVKLKYSGNGKLKKSMVLRDKR